MRKKIVNSLAVLCIMVCTVACKNYKEDYYGPELGVAKDGFTASPLIASSATPNFATGTVYFSSTFNGRVRWKLTMVGQTSGAIKVVSGVSNQLDASNSIWDGSTDTLKLFRKNETVKITLTALGWDGSVSTSLTIANEKNRGYVLGTFENIAVDHNAKNFQDITVNTTNWWFYSFDQGEYDLVDKITDPSTPQGNDALLIQGHDANRSYYIGQVGIGSPPTGQAHNFGPISNVDDFYFNLYLKGSGASASGDAKFVVQIFENDDMAGGIQYDNREDKFSSEISLQYEGWKLHRLKYSDFKLDDSCAVHSISKVHNPDKLYTIGFYFGAKTSVGLSATKKITVEMDHLCVTTNGPLVP